jgi:hypothetical protein
MVQKIPPTRGVVQATDDFTQIRGIGPTVDSRLHQGGVFHFSQLARMKPGKLAGMLNDLVGFTEERIVAQDWIGQAQRLAKEAYLHENLDTPKAIGGTPSPDKVGNSHQRQHYANFNVKLLLDSVNQVRYTEVILAGTKQVATWPGWDPAKLETFFIENAQLHLVAPPEVRNGFVGAPVLMSALDQASEPQNEQRQSSPPSNKSLHGILEVQDVRLMDCEGERLGVMIPAGEPFVVWLILNLDQVQIPPGAALMYGVELYIRSGCKHERQIVSSDEGAFSPEDGAAIKIDCQPMSSGDYNLEVLAAVWPHSQARSLRNQLVAISEGLRIYCC